MKKINYLLSLLALAGAGLTAHAAEMSPATTVSGSGWTQENGMTTSAYTMVLTWDNQDISFTNDPAPSFTLTNPSGQATTFDGEYQIRIGSPYYYENTNTLTLDLGYYNSATGEYQVSIPAGIVKNSDGDTNPAQTIKFKVVERLTSYDTTFKVNPPQSEAAYDSSIGGYGVAPFYTPDELEDVTVGWEGEILTLSETAGKVTCYDTNYTEKDITNLVSVAEGKINLNLSTLGAGTWSITIPEGFAVNSTQDKINGTIYLQFIIVEDLEPIGPAIVSNPREGSYYVDYLQNIQMSFGQPVILADNAPDVTYSFNGTTTTCPKPYVSTNYNGEYILNINFVADRYASLEDPGLYTINIPEGLVTNGEYFNEAFTLQYFIVETLDNYTVTPENKSNLKASELAEIRVTFPEVTTIVANEKSWRDVTVRGGTYGNYIYNYSLYLDEDITIDGNTIVLKLPEVKQVGYWIEIPGKDFIMDDKYTNDYVSLEYTVWDGLPAATILEGPAEDSRLSPNINVLMTWDYQTVTATDNFTVELYSDGYDSEEIPMVEGSYSLVEIDNPESGKGTALQVSLQESLEKYLETYTGYNANYKLTIPAGIIKNADGLLNPAYEFKFSVYPMCSNELAFAPYPDMPGYYYIYMPEQTWMSSLTDGVNISMTNRQGETVKFEEDYSAWSVSEISAQSYAKIYLELDEFDGSAIVLNLTDMPAEVYTINVPEGIALYNVPASGSTDTVNPEASFALTIGEPGAYVAIEEAVADNVTYDSADINVTFTESLVPENADVYVVLSDADGNMLNKVKASEPGTITIELTGLKELTEYVYNVTVQVENGSEVVATSEPVKVTFTTLKDTGVSAIDTDDSNARYFTIEGIEVTNPQPGTIYIKVSGNKATKVIVR